MQTQPLTDDPRPELLEALQKFFGFSSFRPGQDEVVETVLAGRNAVVVMPTGSGKSLCYQLPAMLLPGLTLVVSPLIALMKDQVESMQARNLPAACINSSVEWGEQVAVLDAARQGRLKVLFVTPERFHVASFQRVLAELEVSLLAVDEAHCISEWGHDFRPDYRRLESVRGTLGNPATIALTATATHKVREDIAQQLGLGECERFVFGFERPNLLLRVEKVQGKQSKFAFLHHIATTTSGMGIVYCATRKQTEEVTRGLSQMGIKAAAYHAGLRDDARARVQNAFMSDDIDCLVATMAFGMGVDKSNVRFVVHYNLPASLEAYYQEAGRAGRDGEPAECVLLYNFADTRIHEFFIANSYPTRPVIEGVWRLLSKMGKPGQVLHVDGDKLARKLPGRTHAMTIDTTLRLLKRAGHLSWSSNPRGWVVQAPVDAKALDIDYAGLGRKAELDRQRVKRVVFYATGSRCRTHDILGYFGSREAQRNGHCAHCDNCGAVAPRPAAPTSFPASLLRTAAPKPARRRRGLACYEPSRTVVRKILSCVARLDGRASVGNVTAVLCGSRARKVAQQRLDEVSTWRLLAYLKQREVRSLLDLLVEHGLLSEQGSRLSLSSAGRSVMLDVDQPFEALFQSGLDAAFRRKPRSSSPWHPEDENC